MNYSNEPWMVRCDRFKKGGKWYDTFAIDMRDSYDHLDLHMAVATAIATTLKRPFGFDDFNYVVLDPYHRHAHPIMLTRMPGT